MAGKERTKKTKKVAAETTATPRDVKVTSRIVSPAADTSSAARNEAASTREPTAAVRAEAVGPPERVVSPVPEDEIRERAYHIWKRAGEPHGEHEEHWTLAVRELQSPSRR